MVLGVVALLAPIRFSSATTSGLQLLSAQQWNNDSCKLADRECALGDVNGDRAADRVEFNKSGQFRGDVYVALSDAFHFGNDRLWTFNFCVDRETCMVKDVNADGLADLVAFVKSTRPEPDKGDVWVALSDGRKFGAPRKWSDYFCVDDEECAIGDVDQPFAGDPSHERMRGADLVAFVKSSRPEPDRGDVIVARNIGTGQSERFGTPEKWHDFMCIGDEVCRLADVDGSGRADVVVFTKSTRGEPEKGDVLVALSQDGLVSDDALRHRFGQVEKWHDFFCVDNESCDVADMNGDAKADLVAMVKSSRPHQPDVGDVWVALAPPFNTPHRFDGARLWADFICVGTETCAVADLNSDLKADVVAFTGPPDGKAFASVSVRPVFAPPTTSDPSPTGGGGGGTTEQLPINLLRDQVNSGPVPYRALYPPFGTTQPGRLDQIQIPANSAADVVRFVKAGHSTTECNSNPDAYVQLAKGQTSTVDQIKAIYGGIQPTFTTTNPLAFVACVVNSGQTLGFVQINITVQLN